MSITAQAYDARPDSPPFSGVRLSLMMFLQYAVWGLWLPIIAKYFETPVAAGGLGFSGTQVGWILGLAGSIGAVSAPFIAGQLADRIMNAEKALGAMLILGGLVKLVMTYQTSYASWMVLSILYSILYMPTLGLTNSVAFAHLTDRERQFPPIRAWGTIGWIVASVAFPLFYMKSGIHLVSYWPFIDGTARADEVSQMKYAMLVSGVVSMGYGIYCLLALPKTPPRKDGEPLAFAAAFRLLTQPACLALMAAALLVSMIHQVYFFRTPSYITDAIGLSAGDIGPTMAIGQVSEIVFLGILGLFLKHIGYKWIIILGALSYMARYAIFATIPTPGAMKLVMLLHGMNYGFFFAGAFMFVEKIAAPSIRHSAQTVFGIIILGIGPVLAGTYNQWLDGFATMDATRVATTSTASMQVAEVVTSATTVPAIAFNYATFWAIQAGIALLAAVILMVGFPNRWEDREAPLPTPVPEAAS